MDFSPVGNFSVQALLRTHCKTGLLWRSSLMHGFVGKRRGVTTQSIRTLSLATALAMLIGLFNGAQAQASDYPAFSYTLDSNDNATVTGCVFSYECSGQSIEIPDSIDSHTVVAIGDFAFQEAGLTAVTIPNSVTSIGYKAFQTNQLSAVTLPSSLTTISEWAFNANSLSSITFPSTLTSLGQYSFNVNSLTSVSFLGNGVEDVAGMFTNNSGLTAVDVLYGSTGWGATFGNLPVRVGAAPFTYDVDADGNATVTGYTGTVPANLVIPATLGDHPVIAIGDGAFYESQLTSVSLPSSLIAIGNYAFYHNGLTSLVIPDSVTNLGNSAFQNNSLTSVIISSGIVTISNSAFAGNALTQITIPATVEVIEAYAFYGNQLASVTIPDSVSNIRDYAFYGNLLTSVKFEGNAPIAGYLVFANNGSLQSLTRNYTASGWSYSWSGMPVDVVGAPTEQTITFGPISDQNLVDGSLNLDATASSVLDVSYSSDNEAVCSIADSLVTFLAAGTCSVTATQAGNGIYAAAAPVTQSFEILKSSQLIQFTAIPNQVITDNTLDLDASATSGLDVNFISNSLSICTVSSSTVTFVAAGVCSITVEQTGDDTYASANSITKEFTITKGSQSITFPSIENQEFTTTPFDIAPESSAALDVTITSNSSAVCTYDSELGALIFASAGTCNVTASQAGNDYYEAAPDVTVEFVISAIAPGSPLIVYKRVRARADIWFVPGSTGGSTSVSYEYTLNGGRTWLTMTSSMIKQSLKWPPHDPDATQYEYDFVPPSLTLGTSYSIAVRAINENGESQGSNVVTVKPTAPPRVPTVTGSKYKYRTLWLSLAAPANTGGSKILSYGFSVNHGKWKYISVNKIRTYAAVGFVRKGHTYSVRVRARNAAGPGWISAPRLYTIS